MEATMGWTGLLNISLTLVSIVLAWWALQSFRFDLFLADPRGARAKLLQILLAVILGHQLSRFFIDYLNWSILLKYVS
jgi:uncharacterized integral membrane protein (TIGR02327 family)